MKSVDLLRSAARLGRCRRDDRPSAEERQVGQINPAERVECRAGDKRQELGAEEAQRQASAAQRRMVRAGQELGTVVGCLLVHALVARGSLVNAKLQ